jgi:hypothetical protein
LLSLESATIVRGRPDVAPPQALRVAGLARLDEVTRRAVGTVGALSATSYGA